MDLQKKLEIMVAALTEKGYNGTMHSDDAVGKVSELADAYLRLNGEKRTEDYPPLWLETYLVYNGEDKDHVACNMWMNFQKENPVIETIMIQKRSEHCITMKESVLKNLSISAVPTKQHAVDLVSDKPQYKANIRNPGKLRM
jgi:hypothetical protein